MKFFFAMRHSGNVRIYESLIIALAKRGHVVHLGFLKYNSIHTKEQIDHVFGEIPNIHYEVLPDHPSFWSPLTSSIRTIRDYLRYLDPVYRNAPLLKKRAELRIPKPMIYLLTKYLLITSRIGLGFLKNVLSVIEEIIPTNPGVDSYLRSENPGVFLITPLVDFGSSQLDWLKSARNLDIPTALCVHSWDNLTNKGVIQISPDAVIVWNEIQKNEAITLHGIKSEQVLITGAQCYDKWFETKPLLTKEQFFRQLGFPPEMEYLLYLCSSPFIAPNEVDFIRKWISAVRNHEDPSIRSKGILIRPHPQNVKQWSTVDFSDVPQVIICPRYGSNPIDEESKSLFFNSIFYSQVVVGINTSAMIEAGILKKPVFTILDSEFRKTQEGTLHFHYLVDGGLLHVAGNIPEHLIQMGEVMKRPEITERKITSFIHDFIRPRGMDQSCTLAIADAAEHIPGMHHPRKNMPFITGLGSIFLVPLCLCSHLLMRIKRIQKKQQKKSDRPGHEG
jgi:hypothetical protein